MNLDNVRIYCNCDIYIKGTGVTLQNVEDYEHDTGVGVFRFFDKEKEIATVDDEIIKGEDIILLC